MILGCIDNPKQSQLLPSPTNQCHSSLWWSRSKNHWNPVWWRHLEEFDHQINKDAMFYLGSISDTTNTELRTVMNHLLSRYLAGLEEELSLHALVWCLLAWCTRMHTAHCNPHTIPSFIHSTSIHHPLACTVMECGSVSSQTLFVDCIHRSQTECHVLLQSSMKTVLSWYSNPVLCNNWHIPKSKVTVGKFFVRCYLINSIFAYSQLAGTLSM